MTGPDESVRKIIEETSVGPRMADQRDFLAAAAPDPLPVARADLLYLWDDYHTEYLDFECLMNPVGHRHPMVFSAVADHGRYYGLTAPQGDHLLRWPVSYAKSLSDRFSGLADVRRKVLFCEGEREALWRALSLARDRHHSRGRVGVLDTGWHRWLPPEWTVPVSDPASTGWGDLSALLVAGVHRDARPVPGLREWMLAARAAKVPVVVDESVTGFGRTGVMWAQERTGLTAEVTVLGGPVGGGFPLGAVVALPDFFDGRPDVSVQSGHPVACCAGSTTLDVISFGVLEYMEGSSKVLTDGLAELREQFGGYVDGHHGDGLLIGLRMSSPELAGRLSVDCRRHGLYLSPPVGATVVLAPALVTSTDEMGRAVDLIASTLMSWDESV